MKSLKKIIYPTILIIVLTYCNVMIAQSKDGISFHSETGIEKRIFISGEYLSAKFILPKSKGENVQVYVFNPYGKIVKDTVVIYQNGFKLDFDNSIKGEYTVLANIKGNRNILRNSAAIVASEKEGQKFEFDDWEKSEWKKGLYFLGFANSAIDINKDGRLDKKEVMGYSKFKMKSSSKKFDSESNKIIVFNLPKEKSMIEPKIRLTGKGNKLVPKYSQKEGYGVIDISKATGNFAAWVGGFRGISGIKKVKK